jgi:hypothetical protein
MPVVYVFAAPKMEAQPVLATAGVSSRESGVRALPVPTSRDSLYRRGVRGRTYLSTAFRNYANVCDLVEPPHPPSFLGHPLPRGERVVARWKDQNRSAGRQVRASVAVRLGGQAGCRPGDRAVRRTDPELARTADRRLHRVSVDRPYNGIAFRVIPDSHGCTKPPSPVPRLRDTLSPGRGLNNFRTADMA